MNMARATLRAGYAALALRLQESADSLSANDVVARLRDAISDHFRGTGKWGYYENHFGDAASGKVVYCCDDATCRAAYTISETDGAAKCMIDFDKAEDVVPRVIYEVEAMESAEWEPFVARLQEAGARHSSSDVKMLQSIHDTAKTLGASCGVKESAVPATAQLHLTESASAAFAVDIDLSEALSAGQLVKIIGPPAGFKGDEFEGSSAIYPLEAIRKAVKDGIFHAGLPMRIDHPTKAEEAARPEGSVKDWGAVLAENAVYLDSYLGKSGKDYGPGAYAPIKTFSDHAGTITEKGPFAGASICANGNALTEASGKVVTRKGKPVLKEFTSAEGVDMVTRAGAGGLFLQEAATAANLQQEPGMTADEKAREEAKKLIEAAIPAVPNGQSELEKLVEAAVAKQNAPWRERVLRADAKEEATKLLESVTLPPVSKTKIIERALAQIPKTADGELDVAKFREAVVAEAKEEGRYLAQVTGSGRVFGMGPTLVTREAVAEDPKAQESSLKVAEAQAASNVSVFERIGLPKSAAQAAARGRLA